MIKIKVENKLELKLLIDKTISDNGYDCDLNFIDVSSIDDMSFLFAYSKFNGNISQWNVSNVKNMNSMFKDSLFCGNIYYWDVSNVENMTSMLNSPYNYSDVSYWKPLKLKKYKNMFHINGQKPPYWFHYDNIEKRNIAIDYYHLKMDVSKKTITKKIKV